MPKEDFARGALDSVVKWNKQLGSHLDPLSELILLSLQLDPHLVCAQHLLLGY
jgi:hypothetical protein